MSNANPGDLKALIDELGLTMTAEFVPLSKSRNAGTWESINWKVKLSRPRRNSIEIDYTQGIGSLPKGVRPDDAATETGRYGYPAKGLPYPPIGDVLYSLVFDAEALNYASFEDWADDTGNNVDSRKAEAIYRHCLFIALSLRHMIGDAAIAKLREAFQDY